LGAGAGEGASPREPLPPRALTCTTQQQTINSINNISQQYMRKEKKSVQKCIKQHAEVDEFLV